MLIIIIHGNFMMSQDNCSRSENFFRVTFMFHMKLKHYHKATTNDVHKWGYNGLVLDYVETQEAKHDHDKIRQKIYVAKMIGKQMLSVLCSNGSEGNVPFFLLDRNHEF